MTDPQVPPVPEVDPAPTPDVKEQKPVSMSQEAFDKIVTDRVARAKEAERKELLKALGVDDIEIAKSAIQSVKERSDAEKTDVERERQRADDLQKRLEAAENAQKQSRTERLVEKRDNAVLRYAEEAGAVDAEAVLAVLARKNKLGEIDAEGGKIDDAALKAAVEALKKENAALFRSDHKGLPSSKTKPNPASSDEKAKAALEAMWKGVRKV
jgi:hypothetical protein